jgi:hypothetical protein
MADKLNWGILATGNIAHQFASSSVKLSLYYKFFGNP